MSGPLNPTSAVPLVLMTVGAVAMPAVARRIAVPVAVAEIVFGLVIGRTGFQWVGDSDFISFLADVGFAFFMFLAGLEIDFHELEKEGLKGTLVKIIHSVFCFALVFLVGSRLGWSAWISLAAGATSVGMMVAVMRETGSLSTPFGASVLGFGAVGEALTILLLSVAHLLHDSHGVASELVIGLLRMAILAVGAGFVLVMLRALTWWFPSPFTRLISDHDPSELGVRVGFGMMFSFVGLSMLAGVEPFLGAFVAGTILTYVLRDKGALEHKLSSMAYGFFVPVFFINVGVRLQLDPALIMEKLPFILSFIATMLGVKLLPSLGLRLFGYSRTELLATACLLASPLTLVIAVIDIGRRSGVVDTDTGSAAVAAGIIGTLMYTSIAKRLLRASDDTKAAPDEHAA